MHIKLHINKLSLCVSNNLRWLNEPVKRVLKCDTRPTSFNCGYNVGVKIIIYLLDVV